MAIRMLGNAECVGYLIATRIRAWKRGIRRMVVRLCMLGDVASKMREANCQLLISISR